MHFNRQVPQALDDEHRAQLALLDRLERAALASDEAALAALALPLVRQLDDDVTRHFGFEERELFTRMSDAGDADLAALLAEEHEAIREVAGELRPLAQALAQGPLDAAQHPAFKRLALELVERMVAHIQKETMGLLPLVEDLLDEATDRELAFAHAST